MPTATGMPLNVCFWTESQQESFWLLPHCCWSCWPLVRVEVAWAELEVSVEDWAGVLVDLWSLSPLSPLSPLSLHSSLVGMAMAAAAKAATMRTENCILADGWVWMGVR